MEISSLFEELGILGNVVVLLGSLLVLNKASNLTIDKSVKVAEITGLGKTTIGFIFISFSTTLPELSVSIISVGQGTIGVAVGNAIGSNIANVCLILGICFLIASVKYADGRRLPSSIGRGEARNLYFGLFVASIIPLTLIYIGYASRFIGIILITIFVIYNLQFLKRKNGEVRSSSVDGPRLRRYIVTTFLGVVGVVTSAYFIVGSASFIAISIGIPPVVIGATIVAFGTSLPELINGVNASKKGHLDLALGNIVGSAFVNTTLILGVALVGSPLNVNMVAFSSLVMFSIITNLFLWYFLSGEKISWREGAILLFLYFLFMIISFGEVGT